jgi:hypothetical protein
MVIELTNWKATRGRKSTFRLELLLQLAPTPPSSPLESLGRVVLTLVFDLFLLPNGLPWEIRVSGWAEIAANDDGVGGLPSPHCCYPGSPSERRPQ